MSEIPEDIMQRAREVYENVLEAEPFTSLCEEAIARALLAERKDATERAMKAICSGCASGLPVNDSGFHEHGSFTFPCHASAIRGEGRRA